jgi:hypothetical protein
MAGPNNDGVKKKRAPDGDFVTTRVNVAFPFSQIKVQQPSEDVAALAMLVKELTDLVGEIAPGPKAKDLRQRAEVLATRFA